MSTDIQNSRILVVDDIEANVKMLEGILKTQNFKTYSAYSGKQALEIINRMSVDLVLLDINMPQMDGYEVCEKIKENENLQDIPIIFVSALDATVDKVRGFQAGAVDYVSKPYQVIEVLARIRAHLTNYKQRKEIERLRQQDKEYFQTLNEMRDDVMNMATHDMKNPLNNIILTVRMLEKYGNIQDEKGKFLLKTIENSVGQMKELITGILDIAKIETGLDIKKEKVDLTRFVRELVREFLVPAATKKIQLQFNPPATAIEIEIDVERMKQVFRNLLSNAVKYTPNQGKVTVILESNEAEVTISIQDTGLGIPAEDIPHLFDKFYRVTKSDRNDIEGTGLGLAIAKSIIEQHQGTIHVESEVEQGTTFVIKLPLWNLT